MAPGFIDVHTHDDTALIDNPAMAMKASQGVTTVVCGNCGVSAAPYTRPDVGHWMSLIVKKRENICKDFATFAAKVEAAKPAINGAFLIGHGTLRLTTMGDDLNRVATAGEIKQMRELLDQSLGQGAIGMSSGLFYAVSSHASTDEVAEVAAPLGKHGGVYTAHMRDEGDHIIKAMDETFEIGRRVGAEIIVSHHKCSGPQQLRTDEGNAAQVHRGHEEAADRLRRLSLYRRVNHPALRHARARRQGAHHLVRQGAGHERPDLAGVAKEMGCSMREAADRLQPAGAIYFMMDERDVQAAMSHPGAMIGSDGIPFDAHPHPRLWGTFRGCSATIPATSSSSRSRMPCAA